jgi:murein DD-endopeptidase MepM/ murein hydrolase activator NlpD
MFGARFRVITSALATAAAFLFAQPALANSSATADIAAPLRAAQAAKPATLGNGDEKFRKLFNNWQELEETAVPALAAVAEAASEANRSIVARPTASRHMSGVSIPSLMPVANIRLTSSFGMRDHPISGRRRAHKGIDLAAPTGTPIHASADGIISKAKWFGGYGLFVSIEHGGKIQTRYGHMSRLNVAEGQRVAKGDVIGFVGTTGRSTGPHLHYEVRINGEAVNPVPYLQTDQFAQSDGASAGQGGP